MVMNYRTRKKIREEWRSSPPIMLVYRLLAMLLSLSISRWLLYLFNSQFFHQVSPRESLFLFFYGMRFDMAVTVALNLPLILYYCFPSRRIFHPLPQRFFDIIYVVTNAFAVLLNFIDIVTFHFFGRHISLSMIRLLGDGTNISWAIVGQVLFDHWYLLVIYVLFVLVINVVTSNTKLHDDKEHVIKHWRLRQIACLVMMLSLTLFEWRNELKTRHIDADIAMSYTNPQNLPILLNTPFCMFTSREQPVMERYEYDTDPYHFVHNELIANRFITADTLTNDSVPFNLVVIMLKGIGQEMTQYYNPQHRFDLTPFLDTLLSQSLTFDGRSNSRRTIEALPAVLAGIPSLMNEDFVRSPFADNDFDAFAQHLQKQGYNTIFMHGGNNGTMGYDRFSQRAGFRNYFGRTEYGDDADYDGRWGIYDGPFLQYAAQALNRLHGPFATTIYMLSSRYPYKVPSDFEFPEESYYWTGYEKTVYYADCALRDFFATASKMPWFDNTLFVITSDFSNGEHFRPEYSNVWGMYAIPMAFYQPSRIGALRCPEIAQQIDLGPSILSALNVSDTTFSFGRNLFDSISEQAFVSYFNLTYQYCDGTYLVQSDGKSSFGIFKPAIDPLLNDNLIDRLQCPDVFEKLHRFLQDYDNRMIKDELKPTRDVEIRDTRQDTLDVPRPIVPCQTQHIYETQE